MNESLALKRQLAFGLHQTARAIRHSLRILKELQRRGEALPPTVSIGEAVLKLSADLDGVWLDGKFVRPDEMEADADRLCSLERQGDLIIDPDGQGVLLPNGKDVPIGA